MYVYMDWTASACLTIYPSSISFCIFISDIIRMENKRTKLRIVQPTATKFEFMKLLKSVQTPRVSFENVDFVLHTNQHTFWKDNSEYTTRKMTSLKLNVIFYRYATSTRNQQRFRLSHLLLAVLSQLPLKRK